MAFVHPSITRERAEGQWLLLYYVSLEIHNNISGKACFFAVSLAMLAGPHGGRALNRASLPPVTCLYDAYSENTESRQKRKCGTS